MAFVVFSFHLIGNLLVPNFDLSLILTYDHSAISISGWANFDLTQQIGLNVGCAWVRLRNIPKDRTILKYEVDD